MGEGMCIRRNFTGKIVMLLFAFALFGRTYGQQSDKNIETTACIKGIEKAGSKTCYRNLVVNIDSVNRFEQENLLVIGRNLINGDRTEMGPFVVKNRKAGMGIEPISGGGVSRRSMPKPGIDNLAYAKAMATGKYPKGQEEGQYCIKTHSKKTTQKNEKNMQKM